MTVPDDKGIAVIGCGGFIGSHLVDRLLGEKRNPIYGLDLVSGKVSHQLQHERFSFRQGDIHDTAAVQETVANCSTVVLLAALCNPSLYNSRTLDVIDVNSTGTVPVVRLCAETGKRLIYFSTCEVYGRTAASLVGKYDDPELYLLREDASPFILGPVSAERWSYACAKQLIERVIHAFGRERGLHYTIVRPFNFIGPRMDFIPGVDGEGVPRVLACFLAALLEGKPLRLVDGGGNRRCFTYIDDAIDACVRMIDRPEAADRQTFNIGNPGNEVTIRELADLMVRRWKACIPEDAGRSYPIENVSSQEFYGAGYEDSDRRVPDIGKANRLLDWHPLFSLEEALDRTIRATAIAYRDLLTLPKGTA